MEALSLSPLTLAKHNYVRDSCEKEWGVLALDFHWKLCAEHSEKIDARKKER